MIALPLLAVNFITNFLAVVFVICAVALILIVLIQKGKGGGLSGAFGGGGAGGLMGAKTGDFLTWFTIGLAVLFFVLLVVLAKYHKPSVSEYNTQQANQQQQLPADANLDQQLPEGMPEMPEAQ